VPLAARNVVRRFDFLRGTFAPAVSKRQEHWVEERSVMAKVALPRWSCLVRVAEAPSRSYMSITSSVLTSMFAGITSEDVQRGLRSSRMVSVRPISNRSPV